jgi:hypothetical protein
MDVSNTGIPKTQIAKGENEGVKHGETMKI